MSKLESYYKALLLGMLESGHRDERTGMVSVFGITIRHKMSDGFPVLSEDAVKGGIVSMLWNLRGDSSMKYLVDNNCHIWDGDAYKNYEKRYYKEIFNYETGSHNRLMSKDEFILNIKTDDEFAKKWGVVNNPGKQWRGWDVPKINSISLETVIDTLIEVGNGVTDDHLHKEASRLIKERDSNKSIDQIANLINDLKSSTNSTFNVTSHNPADQLSNHIGFQVCTRELNVVERMEYYGKHFMKETDSKTFDELCQIDYDKLNIPTKSISLIFNKTSTEVKNELPLDLVSYGILLSILAKTVNMVPGELIGNLGECYGDIQPADKSIIEQPSDRNTTYTLTHGKTDAFYEELSKDFSMISHVKPNDFLTFESKIKTNDSTNRT